MKNNIIEMLTKIAEDVKDIPLKSIQLQLFTIFYKWPQYHKVYPGHVAMKTVVAYTLEEAENKIRTLDSSYKEIEVVMVNRVTLQKAVNMFKDYIDSANK